MKVMDVVPDDYMILFFCIDYTVWPGKKRRKIFQTCFTNIHQRLEPPRCLRSLANPDAEDKSETET